MGCGFSKCCEAENITLRFIGSIRTRTFRVQKETKNDLKEEKINVYT